MFLFNYINFLYPRKADLALLILLMEMIIINKSIILFKIKRK